MLRTHVPLGSVPPFVGPYTTYLLLKFLVNNQLDTQLFPYMFISIPYMFRVTVWSSSGESVVSIRHLVYVTLCR